MSQPGAQAMGALAAPGRRVDRAAKYASAAIYAASARSVDRAHDVDALSHASDR